MRKLYTSIHTLITEYLSELEVLLSKPKVNYCLIFIAIVIYTGCYLGHDSLPGNNHQWARGWWGWNDQSMYLNSAKDLSLFNLNASTYWYSLGYPIVGSLFVRYIPEHAFFFPNILFFIGQLGLYYLICRKFISRIETVLLIVLFYSFTFTDFLSCLIVPWNTIPTHFIAYAIIWLLIFKENCRRNIYLSCFLTGIVYWIRPGDAFFMFPLLACSTLSLLDFKKIISTALIGIGICLAFAVAVLLINYHVFGSIYSNYELQSKNIGFLSYDIFQKLYFLLLDGKTVFGETEKMILPHYPWLYLTPVGMLFAFRKIGIRSFGLLGTFLLGSGIYFVYNDYWPYNIYRFHLIHYLYWMLPLLFLFSYYSLRSINRISHSVIFLIITVPIIYTCSIIKLTEVPLFDINLSRAFPKLEKNIAFAVEDIVKTEKFDKKTSILFIEFQGPWSHVDNWSIYIDKEILVRYRDYYIQPKDGGQVVFLAKPCVIKNIHIETSSIKKRPVELLTIKCATTKWSLFN